MQQPENASGRTVGSGRSDDAEQGSNEPSFKQRLRSATKKVVSVATHNPFPPASPGFVVLFPDSSVHSREL